jgi:hypothetical protein
VNPFPGNLILQFTGMISELREMENAAGLANHSVAHDVGNQNDEKNKLSPKKVKSQKYIMRSAIAGGVGGGVVAAVVGSKMQ